MVSCSKLYDVYRRPVFFRLLREELPLLLFLEERDGLPRP